MILYFNISLQYIRYKNIDTYYGLTIVIHYSLGKIFVYEKTTLIKNSSGVTVLDLVIATYNEL